MCITPACQFCRFSRCTRGHVQVLRKDFEDEKVEKKVKKRKGREKGYKF
jgi:hypothetical protein